MAYEKGILCGTSLFHPFGRSIFFMASWSFRWNSINLAISSLLFAWSCFSETNSSCQFVQLLFCIFRVWILVLLDWLAKTQKKYEKLLLELKEQWQCILIANSLITCLFFHLTGKYEIVRIFRSMSDGFAFIYDGFYWPMVMSSLWMFSLKKTSLEVLIKVIAAFEKNPIHQCQYNKLNRKTARRMFLFECNWYQVHLVDFPMRILIKFHKLCP